MSQTFNYEEWKDKYYNKEYIEIMKFLSNEDIEVVKKLGITIENKIYTEYELEIVYMKVLNYYKNDEMDKEDLELSKSLDGTGVSKKEYDDLLGKIEKLNNHYNL